MTESELNRFRDILESRKEELERMLLNRDGIMIEKSADALDEVQHAAERDLCDSQSQPRIGPVTRRSAGSRSA